MLEIADLSKIPFTDLYESFKKRLCDKIKNYIAAEGRIEGKFYFKSYYNYYN